jgi:hypothetical protein
LNLKNSAENAEKDKFIRKPKNRFWLLAFSSTKSVGKSAFFLVLSKLKGD